MVDWKETYIRKSVEHIEDNSTFACNEVDPCTKQLSGQGMGTEMAGEGLLR